MPFLAVPGAAQSGQLYLMGVWDAPRYLLTPCMIWCDPFHLPSFLICEVRVTGPIRLAVAEFTEVGKASNTHWATGKASCLSVLLLTHLPCFISDTVSYLGQGAALPGAQHRPQTPEKLSAQPRRRCAQPRPAADWSRFVTDTFSKKHR